MNPVLVAASPLPPPSPPDWGTSLSPGPWELGNGVTRLSQSTPPWSLRLVWKGGGRKEASSCPGKEQHPKAVQEVETNRRFLQTQLCAQPTEEGSGCPGAL